MNHQPLPELQILGLMSGTSLDGVDVCLTRIQWGDLLKLEVKAFATYPIAPGLRNRVQAAMQPNSSGVDTLCTLNMELGEWFAASALRLLQEQGLAPEQIDAIGSHGQTLYHLPPGQSPIPSTLQMGEPSLICQRTGITTVADFRPADIAVGGHGAPLVALMDNLLFQDAEQAVAVQNIGGIGNVTWLPPAQAEKKQVLAFDTGPGNMVIDRLTERFSQGQQTYDFQGQWAAQGQILPELLAELLRHPYFSLPAPKSTGRELFGQSYSDALYERALQEGWEAADLLATVTALTSHSIARAYRELCPDSPLKEVLIAGGGVHNQTLMQQLQNLIPQTSVRSLAGRFNPDARESAAFALFAYTALAGLPNNLPSVTGAQRPVVMGKICPGLNYTQLIRKLYATSAL